MRKIARSKLLLGALASSLLAMPLSAETARANENAGHETGAHVFTVCPAPRIGGSPA